MRLLSDDVAGSARFRRDLGLEPMSGSEGDDSVSFRAGDGAVAVFKRAEQGETVAPRDPGDGALLQVEDVDAGVARLGTWVVQEPVDRRHWGGRVAYLREPGANLVELFQAIPLEGG